MRIDFEHKFPRKLKKYILDRRVSKSKLKRMLKETECLGDVKTMYERPEFVPYGEFCPKCGESKYIGTGNKTSYPEHWEYFHCLRCKSVVGYIDNSPFYHALQCKEDNYNPVF